MVKHIRARSKSSSDVGSLTLIEQLRRDTETCLPEVNQYYIMSIYQ